MGIDDSAQGGTTDEMLLEALRRRMMRLLEEREASRESAIVNNIYSGGLQGGIGPGPGPGAGGLYERNTPSPEDLEYYVDIKRQDVMDDAGKKIGWNKSVHRYTEKKNPPVMDR